jgi:F0F1-type ATP synthase beta subunit
MLREQPKRGENVGTVLKIEAAVVEAQFPSGRQPDCLDLLCPPEETSGRRGVVVAQRLPERRVRGILLPGTALVAGAPLLNAGFSPAAIVPNEVLARVIPLLGQGAAAGSALLETGIKSIDLMCPLPARGNAGLFGPPRTGVTVLMEELTRRLGACPACPALFGFIAPESARTIPDLGMQDPDLFTHYTDPDERRPVAYLAAAGAGDADYARRVPFLQAALYLSPWVSVKGIYPAVDVLESCSALLTPEEVGAEHWAVAEEVRALVKQARALLADPLAAECLARGDRQEAEDRMEAAAQAIMARLPEEERRLVSRARKLERFFAQPMYCAEPYTAMPGKTVSRTETVSGCRQILSGDCDDLPEAAFYFIGNVDEAVEKAIRMERAP